VQVAALLFEWRLVFAVQAPSPFGSHQALFIRHLMISS
jgi:hypothetical protein